MTDINRIPLYRTIWRWHFYAGLLVIPFILMLSVTGAAYLFKPQLDRWEERDWRGLSVQDACTALLEQGLWAGDATELSQWLAQLLGDGLVRAHSPTLVDCRVYSRPQRVPEMQPR